MDADKIQDDIDILLTFMNEIVEEKGVSIEHLYFEFMDDQSDWLTFNEMYNWGNENLYRIIKICLARSLIEQEYRRTDDFSNLKLTAEGQSRAISVKHGKKRSYELGATMQIATLNVTGSGQTQIGHGNTQNIHAIFNEIVQKIDALDTSEQDKKEAKNLLSKFLEHPAVTAAIGGVAGSIPGLLVG